MKKIALVLALVMLLGAFAGCGSKTPETTTAPTTAPVETTEPAPVGIPSDVSTETLMEKIYEKVNVELSLMSMPIDLTDEYVVAAYTGAETAEGIVEGTSSEPMMGSQAYSISLVRCETSEKAAELAQTMFDNIDTRKWICVEASEKQAAVCGDVVMFVMLDPMYGVTTDQIVDAFTQVCEDYGCQVADVLK